MLDLSLRVVSTFQKTLAGTQFLREFWLFVSNFSVFFSILFFFVVYICISRRAGRVIFTSLFVSMTTSTLLKLLFREPRPFELSEDILNLDPLLSGGFSFPSSHSILCATVAFCLIYEYKSHIIAIPFTVIMFALILSRIVLGAHYLHDCLFSILAAALFSSIVTFLNHSYRFYKSRLRIGIRVLSLLIVLFAHICLLRFGYRTFDDIFYLVEGFLAFVVGDRLERKKVSVTADARLLKKVVRFSFFVLTGALIFFIMRAINSISDYALDFIIVFCCLYCTYFFTKISVVLKLFDKKEC